MKALLALEDGRTFPCRSFTGPGEARGEVVFNTGMTGYQEVLTDPSYRGQMVAMTYPLIGNYGVNPEDVESDGIQVAGFLVREYQEFPSNFRSTGTLRDYLIEYGVLGVEGLDTRALTRHLRKIGAMRAFITTENLDPGFCVERAREISGMAGQNLAREVSTRTPYRWVDGKPAPLEMETEALDSGVWRRGDGRFAVAAFDFGIKYNILRNLEKVGCDVIVVPSSTPADVVRAMAPDGIFLSNGPGDPEPVTDAIETIRALLGWRPMFGICLGHQLMGLALGGKTYKLKFGHRGANQPVKNLSTGKVEITSQNHGFALDIESLDSKEIEITHVNLNDGTLEGFRHRGMPIFTVQYHPEASPGPHDANYLFDNFKKLMGSKL
ncbi:MAG: glutamine-hydrolyzing carbamoyl-phosphate synthase small subunit [Desulfobacterales bacterium]|nr:glutamine-hydrolyzing carbamoyl-phosphate synthase small subunit [Desulfobacterales bacterium]